MFFADTLPIARTVLLANVCSITLFLLALQGGCSSPGTTEGELHVWLQTCNLDADCGTEFACVCGVCTFPCDDDDPCPQGRCRSTASGPGGSVCAAVPSPPSGICLLACGEEDPCESEVASECTYGLCMPPARAPLPPPRALCAFTFDPPIGTLSPSYEANTDCLCTDVDPTCRTLYRGGFVEHDGDTLTLEFLKTSSTGSAAPSEPIQWWLSNALPTPACTDLEDATTFADGVWADTPSLFVSLSLTKDLGWTDDTPEFTTSLTFFTGGGGFPDQRLFFQRDPLALTIQCTTDE
jgi:hypothetical protein